MAQNRFRRGADQPAPTRLLARALLQGFGRGLQWLVVLGVLGALAYGGWRLVTRSAHFTLRVVEVNATAHLTPAQIVALVGLDRPTNAFMFDAATAEQTLLDFPWVSRAKVTVALPDQVRIEVQERQAAGVVVLDQLYLVDDDGHPFVEAHPSEAKDLTLLTGLTRSAVESAPEAARARIREGLALARRYRQRALATTRPLSNVHVGLGDRYELQLDQTRVVLGLGNPNQKLDVLEDVIEALDKRGVDARYILLAEDARRAIVKEVPRERRISASLSVEEEGARN